jgi:hypothetical protein
MCCDCSPRSVTAPTATEEIEVGRSQMGVIAREDRKVQSMTDHERLAVAGALRDQSG